MSDNRTLAAELRQFAADEYGPKDYVTKLLQAAAAALEAASWRPISEAPRDGTAILACSHPDEYAPVVVRYRAKTYWEDDGWVYTATYLSGDGCLWSPNGLEYADNCCNLNYWQPLPPPPAQQETQR